MSVRSPVHCSRAARAPRLARFGDACAPCTLCQLSCRRRPRARVDRAQRSVAARAEAPGAPDDAEPRQPGNKLRIDLDDLAAVAGGWTGQPSRLASDILDNVADLPMTADVQDYAERAAAVQQWQTALQKGCLPDMRLTDFPAEPFRSKFAAALSRLEMPRFTRRYPKLADAVLRQMLAVTRDFEAELLKRQAEDERKRDPLQQQRRQQGQQAEQNNDEGDQQDGTGGGEEEADGEPSGDAQQQEGGQQQSLQEQLEAGQQGDPDSAEQMELQLESSEGQGGEQEGEGDGEEGGVDERVAEAAEALAQEVVDKFEEEMAPVMENVEAAMKHFGDLEALLNGPQGWDLSAGVWQQSGWREFQDLRKRLENLRELRDLVRSLGRGGGKGPMRRAPEEVYASRRPPGVLRSELVPEEVRGLRKAGDLTQMLPAEAAMLAVGWPRGDEDEEEDEEAVASRGSHPARLLFMARLAEKGLMSYQRTGWVDDEPARVTGRREVRPAAELGPIIVCLDTSGSMRGPREVVAKSLVLECMRGAHAQDRKCYVYAFSGPGEVSALELGVTPSAIKKLLAFLQYSFSGGTDVDAPLELSLERLREEEWEAADVLMVTDGEIQPPKQRILEQVADFHERLGLEVHGLLVGTQVTQAMEDLCTSIHMFRSWSAVKGGAGRF